MIAAEAEDIERRRELPQSLREALIEGGFFRLLLPRSLGGAELLPATFVQIIEEIAKADASTAWCLNQNSRLLDDRGLSFARGGARDFWRSRAASSPGGPGPGEARIVAGGYRITTTCSFRQRQPRRELARLPSAGRRARRPAAPAIPTARRSCTRCCFRNRRQVDRYLARGRAARHRQRPVFGQGSVCPRCLFLRRSRASRRARGASRACSTALAACSSMPPGLPGWRSGSRAARSTPFIELARDKIPRGARTTLRNNNVIQSQVAQAEARLASARALSDRLARRDHRGGRERGQSTLDERMTIRLASTFAIHTRSRSSTPLYHAAGATAIFNANPFERRFRDIHTRLATIAGPARAFRDGRPIPARPQTRQPSLALSGKRRLDRPPLAPKSGAKGDATVLPVPRSPSFAASDRSVLGFARHGAE